MTEVRFVGVPVKFLLKNSNMMEVFVIFSSDEVVETVVFENFPTVRLFRKNA